MDDVSGGGGVLGVTSGSKGSETSLLVFKVSLYQTVMCSHPLSWYKSFIIMTSMLPNGDLQGDLRGDLQGDLQGDVCDVCSKCFCIKRYNRGQGHERKCHFCPSFL